MWKFTGKVPYANPTAHVLCEPVQSKRTWTCHKSNFLQKFTRKMPDAPETTSIKHRALTVSVRTPSVWPHCWGHIFQCSDLFGQLNSGLNLVGSAHGWASPSATFGQLDRVSCGATRASWKSQGTHPTNINHKNWRRILEETNSIYSK